MKDAPPNDVKSPEDSWESCPLHTLLVRITRLNRALQFCRGRAEDAYDLVRTERDRLISIYSRRVKESHVAGK